MQKDSLRCFFAVAIDAAATAAVQAAVQPLQAQPWAAKVRWVAASNWHLTLAFLGNQSVAWLSEVQMSLAAALPQAVLSAGVVESRQITGFPDAKSRIVAMEFQAAPQLIALKSVLEAVLRQHGFAPEQRRFRPHITLGRVQRDQRVHVSPVPCKIALPVSELTLYQSVASVEGSNYQALWSIPIPR